MSTTDQAVAVLRLRCPRCLKGKLYQTLFRVHERCQECGLTFNSEPGLYVGSIYPNFFATVVLVTGLYWLLALGFRLNQYTVLVWCGVFFTLFPILIHRHARCLWMTILYNIQNSSTPPESRGQDANPMKEQEKNSD